MRYLISGPLVASFMFQIFLDAASAQGRYPYIKNCTSNYCMFKCETGLGLVLLRSTYNSQNSEEARMPDLETYKYGSRVFTLENNSVHGSTSSQYINFKSPYGIIILNGWNKYTNLTLNGKLIRCLPAWL